MAQKSLQLGDFRQVALCPPANRLGLQFSAGLAFPDQYPAFARHKRGGEVCDETTRDFPESPKVLSGAYIYGGFALHHYGHFIAETLGRLWVSKVAGCETLPVIFMMSGENQYIRPFIEDAMSYFGIPDHIETEHVVVERLYIGEEGKQMRGIAHPQYIQWLESLNISNRLADASLPKKICVLRGHLNAGKIAGEKELEKILVASGYYALRPEKYSFQEQLKYYWNAEKNNLL